MLILSRTAEEREWFINLMQYFTGEHFKNRLIKCCHCTRFKKIRVVFFYNLTLSPSFSLFLLLFFSFKLSLSLLKPPYSPNSPYSNFGKCDSRAVSSLVSSSPFQLWLPERREKTWRFVSFSQLNLENSNSNPPILAAVRKLLLF